MSESKQLAVAKTTGVIRDNRIITTAGNYAVDASGVNFPSG